MRGMTWCSRQQMCQAALLHVSVLHPPVGSRTQCSVHEHMHAISHLVTVSASANKALNQQSLEKAKHRQGNTKGAERTCRPLNRQLAHNSSAPTVATGADTYGKIVAVHTWKLADGLHGVYAFEVDLASVLCRRSSPTTRLNSTTNA